MNDISTYKGKLSASDKIDKVVTSRVFGLPIFAGVMALVYFIAMKWVGQPATDWVNDVLFGDIVPNAIQKALEGNVADWLYSLIQDGIVAGLGAVLGFVPQIIVLFILLAFLEGCGYMARVAFVMDRIFRHFGLSGKSFIPMLIASGCGVPGVMASRTIENERDRRMTVMTTTFVPCSAKLPIIGLIAGALFGGSGWVATSAYFIGVAAIIISGIILKKTKRFAGDPAPFVMELPAYRMPSARSVILHMWEKGKDFVHKAFTVIFIGTIVIWFLQSFDWSLNIVSDSSASILASIGSVIAPLFIPLGFRDWRASTALISGLTAKESVKSTLAVLTGATGDAALASVLRTIFTPLSAFSFLVFTILYMPCIAAFAATKRELGSYRSAILTALYQTGVAYLTAMIIYQLGSLLIQ